MKLITPKKIAEQYGIPVGTLARWRSEGIGPAFHKPVGRVLYDAAEVEDFIRKSRHEPSVRAALTEERRVSF